MRCKVCRQRFRAERSDALTCSSRCLQKAYRRRLSVTRNGLKSDHGGLKSVTDKEAGKLTAVWIEREEPFLSAHQRLIREAFALKEPRETNRSLEGYSVETISRLAATPLILRYEWLGTLGRSTFFVGLLSPGRDLQGAACFGYGPSGNIRKLIGEPALCLERGACVHYAPPNAASFLINAACKLVYRISGVPLFFAYGDPMAGEYGAVYQAAGWTYLGQGIHGKGERTRRFFVLPPGRDPANPANWKATRELRRNGARMSFAQARQQGWQIATREAKHVYATHVGRGRKAWKKLLDCHPYPAPRPELKRPVGVREPEPDVSF